MISMTRRAFGAFAATTMLMGVTAASAEPDAAA